MAAPSPDLTIRPAEAGDLDGLNRVIEAAVMGWSLPERVKRLSLPSYLYDLHDMELLQMLVCENADGEIVAVAAWEEADRADRPTSAMAMLLHGIYVHPIVQRKGVGTILLKAAAKAAKARGAAGLLVKAQPDAAAFFARQGLGRLPVRDPDRDYPHRFWLPLDQRGKPGP